MVINLALVPNVSRTSSPMPAGTLNPLQETHKHIGILRVLVPCNHDDVFCVLLRHIYILRHLNRLNVERVDELHCAHDARQD
jgi:hypothetical protein